MWTAPCSVDTLLTLVTVGDGSDRSTLVLAGDEVPVTLVSLDESLIGSSLVVAAAVGMLKTWMVFNISMAGRLVVFRVARPRACARSAQLSRTPVTGGGLERVQRRQHRPVAAVGHDLDLAMRGPPTTPPSRAVRQPRPRRSGGGRARPPRGSGSRAWSAAAGGCRTPRCIGRSSCAPARGWRTCAGAVAPSPARRRTTPWRRCRAGFPCGCWTA